MSEPGTPCDRLGDNREARMLVSCRYVAALERMFDRVREQVCCIDIAEIFLSTIERQSTFLKQRELCSEH